MRAEVEEPAGPRAPSADLLPDGPVILRFTTPLRLKMRDHFVTGPLRFRDLAFHMLRRVLEMAHVHVAGAQVDWSFQPFLEKADGIRVLGSELRWHDWERWSQRQQTAMKLGGLLGSITLDGDLAPFAGLLRLAEVTHVGKGATFGLGKVEVQPAVCL